MIASPRLQELRATLAPPAVVAASTIDATYTALAALVRPKAEALDARDRQEIGRSHQWRLDVDAKVSGPTPADTQALRDDLWNVVTTSRSAAPVAPGPVALGPRTPPATPPPVPNAAQTAWLSGVTVTAPASPHRANLVEEPLDFQIRSAVPNPGLAVQRRVVVEPAAQVISGATDEMAWSNGAAAADHRIEVNPEPIGGAVNTTFTARVTMPPLSTATFAEKVATVVVEDRRLDWFRANVQAGASCTDHDASWTHINPGTALTYHGGQLPFQVIPNLNWQPNPGLNITMDGELKRSGASLHPFPRTPFGARAQDATLFTRILEQPSPAPVRRSPTRSS
ncbi:MAG: hypothetical protein R3B06_14990 [Kofleriaceae bacterium]